MRHLWLWRHRGGARARDRGLQQVEAAHSGEGPGHVSAAQVKRLLGHCRDELPILLGQRAVRDQEIGERALPSCAPPFDRVGQPVWRDSPQSDGQGAEEQLMLERHGSSPSRSTG